MTNVEGTTLSTFHMAFTNGPDTRLAVADQVYIDREQVSVFSIGNISDGREERKNFWSDPEPGKRHRLGFITLPVAELPAPNPVPIPPLRASARRGRYQFRLDQLNHQQFHAISDAIHRA